MELSNLNIKNGLCISLGANIDSKFGSPLESLLICKPKIEEIINEWGDSLLLKELKKLERFFGREETPKGKKWLSRCLDLDILWWEDFHTVDEELTLPHPRFMNRNFVITPLSEILSRSQKITKFDDPKWSIN